jgi:hypothetical protein
LNYLTISDCALIVDDFVSNRWELLMRFAMGPVFGEAFKTRQAELLTLSRALDKRPLADRLLSADGGFDGFGRAVFYLGEALESLSLLGASYKDTLAKTRATFVPSLSVLSQSYQDEAFQATRNRNDVSKMETELKAFVIGDITLYDVVNGFVAAGIEIDDLLKQRAGATAAVKDPEATRAGRLRGEIVGLLGRLRASVKDEISLNSKLPAKLEVELFAYVDQLVASREAQARAAVKPSDTTPTTSPPSKPV